MLEKNKLKEERHWQKKIDTNKDGKLSKEEIENFKKNKILKNNFNY